MLGLNMIPQGSYRLIDLFSPIFWINPVLGTASVGQIYEFFYSFSLVIGCAVLVGTSLDSVIVGVSGSFSAILVLMNSETYTFP